MILVMDTYAWIEYFKGTAAGREVEKLIGDDNNSVYTSIITITEVSSIFKRENQNAEKICSIISDFSVIYGINTVLAKSAGILHAEMRKEIKDFGIADAIILATARHLNAKIVTGDRHFKGIRETIFL